MRSPEIRERFLDFFERRGHRRLPSASLVAHDDPSVLFTIAGMVPLKAYFLGTRPPPAPRVTSCQKCFRTPDIEEVGDPSHHTFFEMLGNFSFGDYFKAEAIEYAWTLLTEEFGLEPQRLWPSVHPDDHVAEELWRRITGISAERVCHLADNWWQAGPTGPSGFDSEVYVDWGAPCSCGRDDCRPDDQCQGNRWWEIWNLVFMEFDQRPDGQRVPLPRPGIDTGMGLERMSAVLQGVRSNYETDLFAPIVAGFAARARADVEPAVRTASLNVLADHVRAATFLVADGVLPGTEGRGYAVRRVIRRAVLHGRRIGLEGGLAPAVDDVVRVMGDTYPEVVEHRREAERVLRTEEELFGRTLDEATERLEALIASGTGRISGEEAFRLHDTYGLPIELTVELAKERGVAVDVAGFRAIMEEQRQRSRAAATRIGFASVPELAPTTFVGYETLDTTAEVVHVEPSTLAAGQVGMVVVEPSPFYAEAGGQVGDRGRLRWPDGEAEVTDTQFLPGTEVRVLQVRVLQGTLGRGQVVEAIVDRWWREQTMRHHSATHLLHRALREVLGDEVVQRGSLVAPDHTTFDFSFPRPLTSEELEEVERRVNRAIQQDLARTTTIMPLAEARATGAIAIFEEKYGELVRVVDFGGWSKELCGGTHVEHTGQIGAALVRSESSIGAGLRRIDMVAGESAIAFARRSLDALQEVATTLRVPADEVGERVAALQAQVRRLQRQLEDVRRQLASGGVRQATVEELDGLRFAHLLLDEPDGDAVVAAVDGLYAERLEGHGVAMVVGPRSVAVKLGADARARGLDAGELVRAAAAATGGRGGGRPEFARGGIGDATRREAAVAAVRQLLASAVQGVRS